MARKKTQAEAAVDQGFAPAPKSGFKEVTGVVVEYTEGVPSHFPAPAQWRWAMVLMIPMLEVISGGEIILQAPVNRVRSVSGPCLTTPLMITPLYPHD